MYAYERWNCRNLRLIILSADFSSDALRVVPPPLIGMRRVSLFHFHQYSSQNHLFCNRMCNLARSDPLVQAARYYGGSCSLLSFSNRPVVLLASAVETSNSAVIDEIIARICSLHCDVPPVIETTVYRAVGFSVLSGHPHFPCSCCRPSLPKRMKEWANVSRSSCLHTTILGDDHPAAKPQPRGGPLRHPAGSPPGHRCAFIGSG